MSLRQLEQMAYAALSTVMMSFEVPCPTLCYGSCLAAMLVPKLCTHLWHCVRVPKCGQLGHVLCTSQTPCLLLPGRQPAPKLRHLRSRSITYLLQSIALEGCRSFEGARQCWFVSC